MGEESMCVIPVVIFYMQWDIGKGHPNGQKGARVWAIDVMG